MTSCVLALAIALLPCGLTLHYHDSCDADDNDPALCPAPVSPSFRNLNQRGAATGEDIARRLS